MDTITDNAGRIIVLIISGIRKGVGLGYAIRQCIYNTSKIKGTALPKLALWYNEVEKSGFKSFATVAKSIEQHYDTILNYFDNKSTNASAESFNAKIKSFRASFRGVKSIPFFLFRLANIYA